MGIRPGESFLVGEFVLVLSVRRNKPRRTPEDLVWNDAAGAVVVHSSEMHALYQQLDPIARSGINVLILGETGVGKDVLAENLHRRSDRRDKPFLRLNCAAFSESLLESELFGHEQGAFTGATQRKPGLLATASGGTVLLDEIGELPLCLQAKVLHVIETREVLSVGGIRPYSIDVRFLAATNRNLEQEVAIGSFRSDLYYRLATYSVVVPPLRNRRADILPLAREFLRRACLKRSTPSVPSIHPDTAAQLLEHPWPGNLRELRNVMERALVLSEGSPLLPVHLQLEAPPPIRRLEPASDDAADTRGGNLQPKEIEERRRIIEALRSCAGNQSKAAARLGVSRSTLVNRLDVYRIGRSRKHSR
jgi:transcriptional regulator with PAS, ATPase and Fis domain